MINTKRFQLRKSAVGLLLAGCLASVPAFSQEIIKWVDEDGVTHFGHAATAGHKAVQDHAKANPEPVQTSASQAAIKPAVAAASMAADRMGPQQAMRYAYRKP